MSNLKNIERAIQYHRQQLGFERGRDCCRLAGYYELAIEALGKEVPKKPRDTVSATGWEDWACPECGALLEGGSVMRYCFFCGQKIDWAK